MALDCTRVRQDFPPLSSGLVFLDNAASTLKPRSVMEAMHSFGLSSYANVHRGVYRLSMEASKAYEDAHEVVAKFVGGTWEEVVFTRNSTESLQTAALTLYANGVITRGSEILITMAEHHANMIPWLRVAKMAGASVKMLPLDEEGVPRWDLLDEYLTPKTSVVAIGHISNVTGSKAPVEEVARKARSTGALLVLDSAQGVPHTPVNFKAMGVDMAAFSGHKMLGPTGIGVLWIRRDLAEELEPPLGGGGTVDRVKLGSGGVEIRWSTTPWKFEAGTPPIIEAVGLAEAVRYLEAIGMENVERHEEELTRALLEGIAEREYIEVLGPRSPGRRQGIVAFNIRGMKPDWVGLALDRRGIAVRTGLHCAHILHDALGHSEGSVRASLYIYNCISDVEKLLEALDDIYKRHGGAK
ncbi:MAG: cysteine desulfurase [Desulfurococcales archaeon]|nr:cysteine desulfurase [Desulfurococcales archaeon]